MCQKVFTYSPTSMIVTRPPAYDQEFCISVALDCDSLSRAMTSCNSEHNTVAVDLNNCLCNDDMLYLGSRCDIDANERCLRSTLDPTAVYSNKMCGKTTRTGATSRPSLVPSITISLPESRSTYVPPMPSLTVSPGVAATSDSTGKGVARQAMSEGSTRVAFVLIVAILIA